MDFPTSSTPPREHRASAFQRAAVTTMLGDLERWGRARRWTGTDPYDGLNATRLVAPMKKTVLGRRLLTQFVKRSPFNPRPLLGIPVGQSAAALAQVVSGYARRAIPEPDSLSRLAETLAVLEGLRCDGFEEPCWGYHFDVQTRVFFYRAGSPNTIATAFVAMALLDAHEATHEARLLELATGAGDFFLRHVPQSESGDGAFFGYLVGDRTPIHNANMLVCALLARLAHRTGRKDMRGAAEAGVRWTVRHQRCDGSWPYGEQAGLNWVDGFHTGYVLDSLFYCRQTGLEVDGGRALARGLAYYRSALFFDDGTPKYMPHALYPIDAQCLAQGIHTMALVGTLDPTYCAFAWTIFRFARQHMARRDGSFVFQRRRHWVNTAPHIRWVAAPMFAALSMLQRTLEAGA